jgi:CheY-like chemotaxis protein
MKNSYYVQFKIFSRINESNLIEGSGLGLRITALLCESLNGKIYCGSTYNVGSSFVFYIKIDEKISKKIDTYSDKNIILIVEDDIISTIVLKKMIKTIDSNIIIESVNNIKDGLTIIKEQYSSIMMLLTDLNMNDKNGGGLELAQQIRKFEECNNLEKSINIIAMTANSSNKIHEDCIKSGMNHIIYKPIYLENIRDCIMNENKKKI